MRRLPGPLAPRFWGVHLLALAAVGLAGWLGLWQWHAWEAARTAQARDLTTAAPIPLGEALGPDEPFPGSRVGQPVVLRGTWVPDGTVYVTGREYDGRDGAWAITPLEVAEGGGSALLVVRGWTADPATAPPAPTGSAELVAWLQPPQGTGEVDPDPTDDLLPQVRIADAIQHVDQDLYGAYAIVADDVAAGSWPVGDRATNAGTQGLEPVRPDQLADAGRFTAVRNLFYAFQWWLFGAFALFVWWRYLADELATPAESEAAEVPAAPVS